MANHSWGICNSAAVADPALASWRGHGLRSSRLRLGKGQREGQGEERAGTGAAGLLRTVAARDLPDPALAAAFAQYNAISAGLLAEGLRAQIFTQLSDIECEQNGLLTYDRLHKVDPAAIAAANAALLANASALGLHHD